MELKELKYNFGLMVEKKNRAIEQIEAPNDLDEFCNHIILL